MFIMRVHEMEEMNHRSCLDCHWRTLRWNVHIFLPDWNDFDRRNFSELQMFIRCCYCLPSAAQMLGCLEMFSQRELSAHSGLFFKWRRKPINLFREICVIFRHPLI
jgi:hypothetical protein